MLTKVYGKFVVECEDCSETLETGTNDFDEARAKMREEGWTVKLKRSTWEHRCPQHSKQ